MIWNIIKWSTQKVYSLHCSLSPNFIQSPKFLFLSFFFGKGKSERKQFSYAKNSQPRVMRQTTKIKDVQNKGKRRKNASFRFIINILFKLRCYCCQNCNFHNEFQLRNLSGPSNLPSSMTTCKKCLWRRLMKNLFRFL